VAASLYDPRIPVKKAHADRPGAGEPNSTGFRLIGVMDSVVALIPPDPPDEPSRRARDARLQELLSRHGDLLRRTIAKVCPRAMGLSIEEIEQDARVRLWSALKNQREILHPVSYIYKVAVSATLRAIRRAKARREDQFQDDAGANEGAPLPVLRAPPDASPYAVAERREWVRKIDRAMTRLAENRRRAVGLHLRGRTTEEIAGILGWSEPKARNLVHRGLRDLRTHLRSEGIDYGARSPTDPSARHRPRGRSAGGRGCSGRGVGGLPHRVARYHVIVRASSA
jgi:RNA polymerase sigma factor (sigma-70 family)